MMDMLEEICAQRRADAEERAKRIPYGRMLARIAARPPPRDFRIAFLRKGLHVIAEVKRASPSEGMIRADFDPASIARGYAANGATAVSVLCEPHAFLGDEAHLETVRAVVEKPILYKDFITTDYQVAAARAAGADACLLIVAALDDRQLRHLLHQARILSLAALVETHTAEEVRRALGAGAEIIGVNGRDLRTFKVDRNLTANLVAQIPSFVLRIAESGIRAANDIHTLQAAGADGFLVGTELMRAPDPGARLRKLLKKGDEG